MNNTLGWGVLVVVVLAIAGYLVWGPSTGNQLAEGPVKIGVILPLTGDAAVYGEPAKNILQLAADEINAAGGIDGNSIELIFEDAKCGGPGGANAAQKLVNVDGVKVIIGGFCSSESLAAVPIAEAAKVAMLSPGSSSPMLTNVSAFFARNYPSDSTQGSVLANIAYTDKGWKKVAFIQEQTDYALGVFTAFSDTFTGLGGTVTNEQFPTENTDFRSIVSKVKGTNPDAVFLSTQTPAVTARILVQMKQLGWKPNLLVADVVPGDPKTVSENAEMLEGTLAAEFGVDLSNSKFAAMIAAYKAKHGDEPPYQGYAQTEYDSVYIVSAAISAVGYDGEKIAKWLRSEVKGWEGAAGLVTIGENGDPITGHRPEVIMDGKVVPYVK